jgi:hypothetical protein
LVAHARRLAEAKRFQPCSQRCANWLWYGIQPKNARLGTRRLQRARPTTRITSETPGSACWSPANGPARPEYTLARSRQVPGEDHPDTLASAGNLAICLRALGEVQAARELEEDTLARYRGVWGEDYPDTLASANGLPGDLRAWEQGR